MALILTDEQIMLRDAAQQFVADAAPVSHLRALRDADDATGFDRALWRSFGEMGFAGVIVPEADGGVGLGMVEAAVIAEQAGRTLAPSPFLSTAIGAASLLAAGSADQRARWLPGIAAGEAVAALAIDEGARHRPAATALRAERHGNGFRLSGAKRFVQHGHAADLLLVAARTAGAPGETSGITLFAVDPASDGLTIDADRLLDASLAARLTFADVTVDADAVVGEVDGGWGPLSAALSRVRTGAAAEMVGVAAGAAALTIAYLSERKQFGVPIGSFQALQHRAAHLYAEVEVARAAVLKAAQSLDAGDADAERRALVAKVAAGLASTLAVQEGVQMHGGIGMTDAHDMGFYMKHQRVLDALMGDADTHADALAVIAGY